MSNMLSRLRARIRREDAYVYAVEAAPKDDIVARWDHLRLARRRFLVPSLFGAVGVAGLATEAQAQVTTPFLSWPFRSTGGISKRVNPDRAFDAGISVLEFYPATLSNGTPFTVKPGVGNTVMKNATNPLSNFYSTLAAAQADYPFATNLTDEIDWAAWQAAFLYIYNRDNGNGIGVIRVPQGITLINRGITCACSGARIIGEGTSDFHPQIRWNGPDGTKDAPNYMLTFQCTTELGVAVKQLGSAVGQQQINGGAQWIENMLFYGKAGNISGLVGNESHYLSGLRLSQGGGYRVHGCHFGGTLWDGVVVTGAITWTFIEKCFFEGTYRDAIAFWPVLGNFSTTMYIYNNNISSYGRYAILINAVATGASPVLRDNLFEPQVNPSYFLVNPQWFIHGCPASMAIVGCSQVYFSTTYLEISQVNLGFLHLADSGTGDILNQFGSGDSPMLLNSNSIANPTNTVAAWSGTTLTISGVQSGASTFYPGMGLQGTIANITGTTTAGSAVVTGLSSTAALCPGLEATTGSPPGPGTNVIQGTLIASVDSSTQITLNAPARLSATQNFIFRLPPGARVAGTSTVSPLTVSPSLNIPGTFVINGSQQTPDALAYLSANGYTDTTDTRNFWCGGNSATYPTSSNAANNGAIKVEGFGSMFTVGNIALSAGMNEIERCTVTVMADFALDPAHGRAALAVCQAGVIDLTNGLLTVDTTGNSSPFPFQTGQTVFGAGVGNNTILSPVRAFGDAFAQIGIGGTGTGGQGTYNMAASTPLGASSARALWAIAMTAKDIDSMFSSVSAISSSIWGNSYTIAPGAVYQPNLQTVFGKWEKVLEARIAFQDAATGGRELFAFGVMTIRATNNVVPTSGTFLQGSRWWNYGGKPGDFEGWIVTTQGTIGSGAVISAMGHIIGPTTVAQLPAANAAHIGAEAAVTDALSPAIGSIVAAGGSAKARVWCNGTNWTVTGV